MKKALIFSLVISVSILVIALSTHRTNNTIEAAPIESVPDVKTMDSLAPPFQSFCETGGINPSIFSVIQPVSLFQANPSSNTPSLVSDEIAYMMAFRLINSHGNDPAKIKSLRAYIRQNLGISDPSDILAVFRLASDFNQRSRPLDNHITAIKNRYHAMGHPPYSDNDRRELVRLDQNKERVVSALISELPSRMSLSGRNRLNQRIQNHVKAKIKFEQ